MYVQLGLRAILLGGGASGAAGAVAMHGSLPTPLRLLLVLATGGLWLCLAVSVALLVVAVAFRLCAGPGRAPHPTTNP
jgi:hypothetical protein